MSAKLVMEAFPIVPVPRRLQQEGHKFQFSLGYRVKPGLRRGERKGGGVVFVFFAVSFGHLYGRLVLI